MSSHQETPSEQPSTAGRDFDTWRKEVATFCRQTVFDLQQLLETIKESGDLPADHEALDRPAHSAATANPNAMPSSVHNSLPAAPRDLDASQDRLATLKRELAEKLSNVAKDDRHG